MQLMYVDNWLMLPPYAVSRFSTISVCVCVRVCVCVCVRACVRACVCV